MTSAQRGGELRLAALLGLLGFLLLLPFHQGHFESSDEVTVYEATRSLTRGAISVPALQYTYPGRHGDLYSQYALGQSVLALPFYGLGRLVEAGLSDHWTQVLGGPSLKNLNGVPFGGTVGIFFVGLYGPFMTGVLLALFFLFERELGASRRSAAFATLLLGTTTYVAAMSGTFFRHTTEAVTIVGSLLFFFRWKREGGLRDLAWGSVLASATPLIRLPAAAAGGGLALYLGWVFLRRWREGKVERLAPVLLAVGLPFALAALAHLATDWLKWGNPFRVVMRDVVGFDHSLWAGLSAYLLSPGLSIFVFSPLLLLAPWTFAGFLRRHRIEAAAVLVLVATFLVVFSTFDMWWAGFASVGPRYLFIAVPLLMLPLGPWLDAGEGRVRWIAAALLALPGAAVQLVLLSVDFTLVMASLDYPSFEPPGGYVFLFDARSPLAAMGKALVEGRFIDPWLWRLYHGTRGIPAEPGAALAILFVWATCSAACVRALRPALGREEPAGE